MSSPTKFSNLQDLNTYKDLVPRSSLLPFTWRISKRPLWHSLRTADAFPVAIFRRERSDDRKCVCCSQASCGKVWQRGRSPDYSPFMLLRNYVQGAAHFFGLTLFSFLLQISMNVTMESMIAFRVWLPVKTHWVRLIVLVTMDT